MKPKPASLEQIQRWMQSVIMHPGGVAEGLDAPEARAQLDVPAEELESVIARSAALDSAERLEIYVHAYHERLLECLREEFVATREALGTELFEALAFGYLQHYPSRSYTLNSLGARFAQFLGETRLHEHAAPQHALPAWTDFVIELAGFERTLRDVFDGEGNEGRPGLDLAELATLPAEAWGELRFVGVPCLRLCHFAHPVHGYWAALKQGLQPAAPSPRSTHLAVHRRAYSVETHELEAGQYVLLSRLLTGEPLAAALDAAAQLPSVADELVEANLQAWFAEWTARGYFASAGVAIV